MSATQTCGYVVFNERMLHMQLYCDLCVGIPMLSDVGVLIKVRAGMISCSDHTKHFEDPISSAKK